MSYLHNRAVRTWISNAVAIAVLVAILLAAWFILDLGSAVSALGVSLPDPAVADLEVVVAQDKPAGIATLLTTWEYTEHCQSLSDCSNCAIPAIGNPCKPVQYNCPIYTFFFPGCCGTYDCTTNTFSGTNTCATKPRTAPCANCCSP
jgi:hypothetical protein